MEEVLINKIAYKKNVKHYNMYKKIKKPNWFIMFLEKILVKVLAHGVDYKIIKDDLSVLDGKPFIILCNHSNFLDFILLFKAFLPRKVHGVANLEAFRQLPPFLLESAGVIPKRKFLKDLILVRQMIRVANTKDEAIALYPEARYSITGELADLPSALGKIIKKINIPVAVFTCNGNYLQRPIWSNQKNRKVPITCTAKVLYLSNDLERLSADEIQEGIKKAMYYDAFKYQKEKGFLIKEKFRAEGLEKIIYKCPHCNQEFQMSTKDNILRCDNCGVEYSYNEDSSLTCLNNTTIYDNVRDWLNYEREEVRKEVINGTYSYTEKLRGFSMPHPRYVIELGEVEFTSNMDGLKVTGEYNNQKFMFIKKPLENIAIQVEHYCPVFQKIHLWGISTEDDCIYCVPKNPEVITKVYFGVEELYKYTLAKQNEQSNL